MPELQRMLILLVLMMIPLFLVQRLNHMVQVQVLEQFIFLVQQLFLLQLQVNHVQFNGQFNKFYGLQLQLLIKTLVLLFLLMVTVYLLLKVQTQNIIFSQKMPVLIDGLFNKHSPLVLLLQVKLSFKMVLYLFLMLLNSLFTTNFHLPVV